MHNLWSQYITILLQLRPADRENGIDTADAAMQTSLCAKLTKADFSGAKVKVVKAKNKQLEGLEGIIVRETTRTFIVINSKDEVKTLLKEGSVFQFILPSLQSRNT